MSALAMRAVTFSPQALALFWLGIVIGGLLVLAFMLGRAVGVMRMEREFAPLQKQAELRGRIGLAHEVFTLAVYARHGELYRAIMQKCCAVLSPVDTPPHNAPSPGEKAAS